jgi:predicted metal-dependent peptidase
VSPGTGSALDQRKLAAARLAASAHLPYLSSAVFAAVIVANPGSGTVSVDRRWQIHADPDVVDVIDPDDLGRLILHLVGHLLRSHAGRAFDVGIGPPTAERWNRCADAEINDDLAVDGLVPSMAPDLPAAMGCADGGLVEDYYGRATDGPRSWDCGSGADNVPRSWEGDGGIDGQQSELLRLSVAADIQRQAGQHPGTVPGGWIRWAERILPSRTDWRRALAAEIRHGVASVAGNVDYSYRRPSRRASTLPDVVLPSLRRPVPDVAVVCDTSGSMHEELLARALGEVEGILTRAGLRQAQVRVLAVDTTVHAVRRVSHATQVELVGGGGTDMGRGIEAAAALRPRPSVIVVLTDGFTPWPEAPPPGVRVVVGILMQGSGPYSSYPAPAWARTILIEAP